MHQTPDTSKSNVAPAASEPTPGDVARPHQDSDRDSNDDDDDPAQVSVAEYIVQFLADCGVTHVFGGHGGAVVPLINAICRHPDITWVYVRCEVNASLAAAAYAKLSGGLGCCIGTSGPGASHLTTGLLDAELDGCPVLCITGMKSSDKVGFSDFQDIGQTEIFKAAGIESSKTIMHSGSAVALVRAAASAAMSRCACCHLAIPCDIQQVLISAPPRLIQPFEAARRTMSNTWTLRTAVAHMPESPPQESVASCAAYVLKLRKRGERILIAVGHRGVDAGEPIACIADTLGIPVVTTLDAKGAIPESHPLIAGVLGIFGNPGMEASLALLQAAEVVVSVGIHEHTQLLMTSAGVQQRRLVRIDSSSAAMETHCQAVHTLLGDVSQCCTMLLNAIDHRLRVVQRGTSAISEGLRRTRSAFPRDGWSEFITDAGEGLALASLQSNVLDKRPSAYRAPQDEITDGFCHPGRLLQALSSKLPEHATVCVDVGDVTLWTSLCLCLSKPGHRTLASMRLGTMGYSLCASLAAAALQPDSHVVAIAGDGGIQMSINELSTLQQLPVRKLLVIVLVNRLLGRVANEVWGPAGAAPASGCEILTPDFCKMAEAHGGVGIRIATSNPEDISRALDRALECERLCVLEVMQDPAVKPLMAKHGSAGTSRSPQQKQTQ